MLIIKYEFMKHCPKCDQDKESKEFCKDPSRKSGLAPICKKCKKVLEEIRKCEVLCVNCHRKLHYEERLSIL